VTPPRGDHPRRRARGWVATTVRQILHNASYIGRQSYNAREWRKQPGTNKRRYRRRAVQELITTEDLKLRIVEQELWDAVQQRLEQVREYYTRDSSGRAKGRAIAGGATPYLFGKLLKCGECGSAMVVSGGSATAYYRCGDHVKRGTCANSLGVREDVLRERLLDELRHTLVRPAGLTFARKCIAERLGEIERERRLSLDDRRRTAAEIAAKIESLVDFIAGGQAKGSYDAIRTRMAALEAEKVTADRNVLDVERQSVEPVPLPTPEQMLKLAFDLDARLRSDTHRGREELRELFKDGLITLVPQPGGFYVARSEVLPLVLITRPPPEGGGTRRLVARGGFEPPTFGL
jgi:site-specific DNA recombinase